MALKDGMNVKQLYIEDQIQTILKQSPDMTREEATKLLDEVLIEQGYSIEDVLNAKGLSVTFDMPENQMFNGVYAQADKNPYSRNVTKVHEDNHLSRNHNADSGFKEGKIYEADGFRTPVNQKEQYYHNQEKSSFGTEILSILGKDKYNLTGEELKYLYNNKNKLPLQNGVKELLNMITDFDKAADWINNHSNIIVGSTFTGIGLSNMPGLINNNNNE